MIISRILVSLALAAALGLGHSTAFAQSTRTWVSGVGNDANPCTRTAPCQTFAGAISRTAAGGEINCIDAGGFGVLMITKAISISCPGGEAGVMAGGTDGIIINAGPGDIVHLCGLDLEGMGSGLSGINIIQAGQVRIVNSTIRGFATAGIYVEPGGASGGVQVDVINSVIADNPGSGIRSKPSSNSSVSMLIDGTLVSQNMGDGIMANGTLTTGSLNIIIRNTNANFNAHCGFISYSSGAATQIIADGSSAIGNVTTGVLASGAGAKIMFSHLIITGNGVGVGQAGGGTAMSYGNSTISGNTVAGNYGTAPPLQ